MTLRRFVSPLGSNFTNHLEAFRLPTNKARIRVRRLYQNVCPQDIQDQTEAGQKAEAEQANPTVG